MFARAAAGRVLGMQTDSGLNSVQAKPCSCAVVAGAKRPGALAAEGNVSSSVQAKPCSCAVVAGAKRPGTTAAENPASALNVIVTGTASDSHTWNLVFLQMLLEEQGHRVRNLGPCVPVEQLVEQCRRERPALVVMSSVNGHGVTDGLRAISAVREDPQLEGTPVVIGGKLGIAGIDNARHTETLLEAGFDAVFEEGAGLSLFRSYVDALPAGASS